MGASGAFIAKARTARILLDVELLYPLAYPPDTILTVHISLLFNSVELAYQVLVKLPIPLEANELYIILNSVLLGKNQSE